MIQCVNTPDGALYAFLDCRHHIWMSLKVGQARKKYV